MAKTVADALWEMLVSAGVKRCDGIVGDALNPMIDALRRNGSVDFSTFGTRSSVLSQRWPKHVSRVSLWPSAALLVRGPSI
jgi:thiamine pyrophosphate-dependent acetolactate synthase large subunit-like protein